MKKHAPLIVLVVLLVALGAYWLIAKPGVPADTETPTDQTATTTEDTTLEPGEFPVANAPTGGTPAPATGGQVVQQTLIKAYMNDSWAIIFRYDPLWEAKTDTAVANEVTQLSLSGKEGTVLVSKEKGIGMPSRIKYTTRTETIAGQQVEVREYTNPNDTFSYYLYFMLNADGDEYYVSIKSYNKDRKPFDDFIRRITIK